MAVDDWKFIITTVCGIVAAVVSLGYAALNLILYRAISEAMKALRKDISDEFVRREVYETLIERYDRAEQRIQALEARI